MHKVPFLHTTYILLLKNRNVNILNNKGILCQFLPLFLEQGHYMPLSYFTLNKRKYPIFSCSAGNNKIRFQPLYVRKKFTDSFCSFNAFLATPSVKSINLSSIAGFSKTVIDLRHSLDFSV